MSFMSDYKAALKKLKKEEEEAESKGSSSKKTSVASNTSEGSFMEKYRSELSKLEAAKEEEEDIAPALPVLTRVTQKKEEDEKGLDFFKKGLFEDGYDFGDISKTILGTAGDIGLGIAKGVGGIAEGVADLVSYGVAGVADKNGHTQYADEVRERAKENFIADILLGDATDYVDKYSALGRTSDAVAEGIGQVGAIMATGGLGAAAGLGAAGTTILTTGAMGLSGMGSGMTEAYNSGATDEEATTYGIISGAADALTEMLFGGMGKAIKATGLSVGLSSADDMLAKKVSKLFSKQIAKNFAEFGIKAGAEGFEEVLAGIAQAAGKKATYMSEEEFSKILEDENLMEQFVVGSVTSGIAQSGIVPGTVGGSLKEANKTGRDFVTGLSENEQKVVDKVYQDYLKLKEEGKTNKSKAELYDEVLDQMEKGYISTDTIEEVLGDRNAYDSLVKESEEYKALYETESGKLSERQKDRLAELKEKNKVNPYDSALQTAKGQLSQDVFNLVQGDRLVESYNEKARKSQAFEADLSQYDEKQKQTIQNAINSGTLNNARRTHEMVDFIAKISADKGVLFDFTNNEKIKGTQFAVEGKVVNGYVTDSGITLNVESPKYLGTTVGHEITHVLEGTEMYDALKQTIFDYAKSKGEYDSRMADLTELYKDIEGADIEAELTADLVGEYLFRDKEFVNRLSTENRNIFQKIYDEIKYLCRVATAGSKEARELEKVRKAFEDAYRAESEETRESETQYSVTVTDKDTIDFLDNQEHIVTYKAMQLIDGKLYPPMAAKVKDANGRYQLTNPSQLGVWQQATEDPANIKKFKGDVGYYTLNKGDGSSVDAAYNPYEHSSNLVLNDQFESAHRRDNLVTVQGIIPVSEMSSGYKAQYAKDTTGVMDWHSGVVASKLADNKRQVYLSRWFKPVRILPDSEVAAKYKEVLDGSGVPVPFNVVTPALLKELENAGVEIDYDGTPMYQYHAKKAAEKAKYSISDSDGKQLTKEQQEYFKDSKMRDENGNLKVMYHGSQDAGFHEFDARMSDDDTSFFFIDSNEGAETYSGTEEVYEARTIRSAEDMNNFLAEMGEEDYRVVEENGKFTLYQENEYVADSDTAQGIYEEYCDWVGVGYGDANYKVYLNLKNPLEVDAEGRNWDNVSREFSQEVYDAYQSLTETEKDYLRQLASWEDVSVFRDEILDVVEGDATQEYEQAYVSAYNKLGGKDADLNNLFAAASEGFTEEAIRENAVKRLKTRDYAQKAKAEGYDGVIFKNIVDVGGYGGEYTPSTVAIAFESNQIKSTANAKPTGNADIRYSLSDSEGREVSPAVAHRFGNSKVVDENGRLKVVYHGTASGEFTIFDKAKGSVEGDFGSGFYFTDNETDVSEHYEGGGPDFDNKVARLAEQIEQEEDIDYEEAEEKARAELFKGGHKFEVYLNIENPAIVGKTYLFDSDFGDRYNEEDFEDYDEYIGETEQAVADAIDEIIWEVEKNVDVYSTDGLADVIYDAYSEGGIGLEELKDRINQLYLEDNEGNFVGNEVVRQIIESLGYDGIIDPTVSGKWNMDIEEGTTHYIAFKPNQIKAVTNENPTDNPDIHRSLSRNGEQQKWQGNLDVPANEMMLQKEVAPVGTVSNMETVENKPIIAKPAPVLPEYTAPAEESYSDLLVKKAELESRMMAAVGVEDMDAFTQANEEYDSVMARIEEMEQYDQERVDSLEDTEAPPEIEAPYYEMPEATNITKKAAADIARQVRTSLGLTNMQMADARSIIEQYRSGEITGREQLISELQSKFGRYTEKGRDDALAEAQAFLKTIKVYVPDHVKRGIADFNKVRQSNFGKIRFSKEGAGIDQVYQDELRENYPEYFPAEYDTEEDQLRRMIEVANWDVNTETERTLDIGAIEEAADAIIGGITEFRRSQDLNLSEKQAREGFKSLLKEADHYAPVEDIGPVKATEAPVMAAKAPVVQTTEKYEAIRPKRKAEPKLARATPEEQQRIAEVLNEEPSVANRKNRAWAKFKANVLDKGAVFEDLSLKHKNRNLMGKWNYMLYSEARAQRLMGNGTDGVKSLNAIREEVGNTGKTKQFYEYLYHKHNIDRMTLAERFEDAQNKPVFGDSVTADVSRAMVKKLEIQNPMFREYAKDVYRYMGHLRQQLVDNGVISQETANLWARMYPNYVPIRRAGDTGLNINVPLDTRKTGVNAPVKRATGGSRDILPLFDTMGQRTIQTYKAIAKNSFGVELKNTLRSTIGNEATSVDDVIDSIDMQDGLLQEGKNGKSPTFTVFENGEKVTFEIDEDMYDALRPVSEGMSYTNKVLNTASNIHRGLLTEYNPVFLLTNAVKDSQDILINSQHPWRTYSKIPEAYAQLFTKGYWYQEYMDNGGEQNTYFDNQTSTFTEESTGLKRVLKIPFDVISAANNFIEMTPRLAEYIASREAGRSVEVAMLDSARVTTNFAAGGDLTKMLNRNGVTFLNASVQGAMQQVRNVREANANGLKGWANLATKFVVAGLPAILLNNLVWDDDEEYEELSDYVKQNYYIVGKYGDGNFIRIPKGRTLAVIQEGIEQISNALTGDDEVDLMNFLELVVSNLAPNSPLDNNILAPIIQAVNNETWYGEDLVPTRLQDLPAGEQFDESTDFVSKWLGDKLNISPVKINYLLNQYSGGVGDVLLPMITPEAERGDDSLLGNMIAPLKDKFSTNVVMNNQNVSDFYDLKDELTTNAKASGATDEDKLMYKYINSVNSELAELYQQKREIQNSDLSSEEKYDRAKEIQEQIVDLMKTGMGAYTSINIDGEYATVGDRYFKQNEEGEWEKLSDEQATKYTVTKAAGDSSYATDGTNHYRWYVPEEGSESEPGWKKITDDQLEKQEEVTSGLGISPEEYWGNKEEYDYAYEHPENYAVAKAVGGYDAYRQYSSELYDIKADKDEYGKSISGSRKEKVQAYIDDLDADYYTKLILFKSEYTSYDDENYEIIDYLNNRDDISFEEMRNILIKLGFEVDSQGNISW